MADDDATDDRKTARDRTDDDAAFRERTVRTPHGVPGGRTAGRAEAPEQRAPLAPDNSYSRESYAIHATRSELPLFSDALAGRRDDAGWLSSLSGVLSGGDPDAAASTAESAIDRRRRDSTGS